MPKKPRKRLQLVRHNTYAATPDRRSDGCPAHVPDQDHLPDYPEIVRLADLFDEEMVARDLKKVGWAFTDDDTDFLSHDLHPYPAKFIPQIPGHLIARLSLRGDLVLDPFGGSGTTALEAVRLGRRAVSVDANYVGVLAGRVKTTRLDDRCLQDLSAMRSALLAHLDSGLQPDALRQKYASCIPDIPNLGKWFAPASIGELALIRSTVMALDTESARNIGLLSMSKIVNRVSFQDSETRYASRPRDVAIGQALRLFLGALDSIVQDVSATAAEIRYGIAAFHQADARDLDADRFPPNSVDLVVTSPPYGNAMDYHLYHRFRLFWLGADPRELAKIEVGSHLRHQKEATGFDDYRRELAAAMHQIARVLKPGRYAAIVLGDSVYKGVTYPGGDTLSAVGTNEGMHVVCVLKRALHTTKRSFLIAGRRATSESIVVLRKKDAVGDVVLAPPPYKLWEYEARLRRREVIHLSSIQPTGENGSLHVTANSLVQTRLRRLAFTHVLKPTSSPEEPTWQAIVENGFASARSARKDPKYVTHGLHDYKGKFYPQLAKALINISGVESGATVLDPFCGSGTTLLESYLNGLAAYGMDMNPLAAKIAKAKVGILDLDPVLVTNAIDTLKAKIQALPTAPQLSLDQFASDTHDEICSWFAEPVVAKINAVLRAIRSVSAGKLQDFLEVILSSIVRDVSQQEPGDLRIRRRKVPLKDADVIREFLDALTVQRKRVERFWTVRGFCPYRFHRASVFNGDSREWAAFASAGINEKTVDLVLTSPPYATALPYIDTDRLSILLLCGASASVRRPLEQGLTGSREITTSERRRFEDILLQDGNTDLPAPVVQFIKGLHAEVSAGDAGFRRANMPALLLRFFLDMQRVFANVVRVMKPGAQAMVVMGDNVTTVNGKTIAVPSTDFVGQVAERCGLRLDERMPITVTTENLMHMKNAIKRNEVLMLSRR